MYAPFKELLKHRGELKAWLGVEAATHYQKFLTGCLTAYLEQLASNFLDDKGRDVSPVIRGRIYQIKEIIELPESLDSYDKMKRELAELEAEGYSVPPVAKVAP